MLVDLSVVDNGGQHWAAAGVQLIKTPATPPGPVPAPPAPPTVDLLPGVHADQDPAAIAAAYPHAAYTRLFIGPDILDKPDDLAALTARVVRTCQAAWAAHLVPILSIKLNVAQVMAGRWDATLKAFGQWLARQPPTPLVIWHEPEDDMPGATFAPYFNRARAAIKAGWSDASVIYVAMAYQWAPDRTGKSLKGHTDDVAAWRTVEADGYAIDAYNGRSFPLVQILPEHPGFARWYDLIIRGTGRPWLVAERGFEVAGPADNAVRAATIRRETAWLLTGTAGCTGWVYFNSAGTENAGGLVLDDLGEEALRDAVSALAQAAYTG